MADKSKKSDKQDPKNDGAEQQIISTDRESVKKEISTEMEQSYLDYAMSVIVSRALPDVRDGLKPVHRRILFAMHELGLGSGSSFRKSALIVGEVLGKYHPHGDSPVYEALVRMAQDFSMRYPLVRGQGNFGSIDGDGAAAMRYTESKMEKITEEILADIEKDTVEWQPNYDGRLKEPRVMPTRIPQLLLNGSTGIAVGMATSIPPHNLGEVVDAIVHVADNAEATIDDLMQFIKGPDFPTGGLIYDVNAIKTAYATGRGGMVMRAVADIEERKGGKFAIIISEIPYQVNKKTLVEKIADLVREKKIIGISDLRDESNREGIRVVIELKKDSYPKKILNQLFKLTPMQTSFNMNMIALVDSIQPRLLDLKQVLLEFIKHRKEVITRRTQFDLRVAQDRVHILEGLKIALDNIDAVIATIRGSDTKEEAHESLMKKFKLSDRQSKAILEMRLQTLAGLERKKIEDEYKQLLALIEELESILRDEKKVLKIMKKELSEVKEKYASERKTKVITEAVGQISQKDTIPNEAMIVVLTQENYIKRMPPSTFRAQNRGGKGIIGATTKEEDEIKIVRSAMTHDEIMLFTNTGRVFKIPVYDIPVASRTARGQAIVNLLQLKDSEFITAMFAAGSNMKGEFLFMATKKGHVKKTELKDFTNVRKTGMIAIKLRDDDSLEWVRESNKGQEAVIITRNGKSIRFNESDVRPMGRASMGVRGISLKDNDRVVEMDVIQNPKTAELLVIMENGLGKSTTMEDYRLQKRGGSGVKTANVTERTGHIIGARVINEDTNEDLLLISKAGQVIRLNLKQVPSKGCATQGVYLMRMDEKDMVASMSTLYAETPEEAETAEAAEQQTELA
ncbi:DNA gyrase subunit A [Candidatus Gracilibacteria bacterium]|nr:DNA gyrase subunit A [Candidatus Gracilibacteria bacterium]